MPNVPQERRGAPRLAVELHVEFRHLGRPAQSYAELCRNISAGGVFVSSTVTLEVGTRVQLLVSSGPRMPPVQVEAEVLRVEDEPVGTASKVTRPARGMALGFLPNQAGEVGRLVRLAEGLVRDAHPELLENP